MRVCLGGTFWPFHAGHEALLRRAFEAAEVFVGITDGALAKRPDRAVPAWPDRARVVEDFARRAAYAGSLLIRPLGDAVGPAAHEAYDAIVVSPETVPGAAAINAQRRKTKLPPLAVWVVPHAMAADRLPISSTRIHAGDIDRDGTRLTPVRIAVGSPNKIKHAGVAAAMGAFLPGLKMDIVGFDVATGVPEQPRGKDTMAGARQRARAALAVRPHMDYAVGVEAGLQQDDDGAWFDVQACAVLDRVGRFTEGWGPAFVHPDWVTKRALAGEMVSDILGPVAGDHRIGGTTGAIGFLSDGAMNREELTRIGVLMALLPRWRPGLYVASDSADATAAAKRATAPGA